MKHISEDCGKVFFETKKEAKDRLKEIAASDLRERTPVRVYHCSKCFGWHLTAFTKEAQNIVVTAKIKQKETRIKSEAFYWAKKKGWNIEID